MDSLMATAGIGSNKESQIKYLRAQAEYDFAWTKYFDEICEVIARYDGKQATKRINTALKKVNSNISFDVEKGNGGRGYIYIGWYDFDGRIWRNDSNDEWAYLRTDSNKYHIILVLRFHLAFTVDMIWIATMCMSGATTLGDS